MVVARLNLRYLAAPVRSQALLVVLVVLVSIVGGAAACKGSGTQGTTGGGALGGPRSELAADDEPAASYGKAEIQRALIAERADEASGERTVAELETSDDIGRRTTALADLAVRRRAIAILEICEATGRGCPPRLDTPPWQHAIDADSDPVLEVPLRFDIGGWRKVADELHWRSCSCRTSDCIESIEVTIARLEVRPMADVGQDDTALTSIGRARGCLLRLRGKRALPRLAGD